ARQPLLLFFLGSLFLAVTSVSVGLAFWENQNPQSHLCVKRCSSTTWNLNVIHWSKDMVKELRNEKKNCANVRRKGSGEMNDVVENEKRNNVDVRKKESREKKERHREREGEREEEQEGQGSQNQDPYHFRSHSFQTRFHNERGRVRVFPRFDRRSHHLRWLRNYRYVEFELQPHSLFLPHHRDAEALIVYITGRAIASIANQTNRETFHLEEGDLVRFLAGSLIYTANVEGNQRFRAANLVFPINSPGQYEGLAGLLLHNLYPSGNQNPQAYYNALSEKTLE
ncbi:conglutin beta 1-like, partial [Neltuma alba]|uniref:conglutin beta 1-like n=1 Tax=Neltuma alba TaxID=207710 RepID=UPI0010A4E39B